ncbi:MAG: hypothetical protein P8R02_01985 [Pseudomonadales bacterium]|nr:hypothetical protein [Pseudomonadales bacterium]
MVDEKVSLFSLFAIVFSYGVYLQLQINELHEAQLEPARVADVLKKIDGGPLVTIDIPMLAERVSTSPIPVDGISVAIANGELVSADPLAARSIGQHIDIDDIFLRPAEPAEPRSIGEFVPVINSRVTPSETYAEPRNIGEEILVDIIGL